MSQLKVIKNDIIKVFAVYHPGAYTEIVIRGGPGVEVEVNLASAEGVSHYRPRGSEGMLPQENFWNIYHKWCIIRAFWRWFGNKNLTIVALKSCTHLSIYYTILKKIKKKKKKKKLGGAQACWAPPWIRPCHHFYLTHQ